MKMEETVNVQWNHRLIAFHRDAYHLRITIPEIMNKDQRYDIVILNFLWNNYCVRD